MSSEKHQCPVCETHDAVINDKSAMYKIDCPLCGHFAWMPVETLVHYNQALYYKALQDSHRDGVDCSPFIDFMLDAIENSLYKYVDLATETRKSKDSGLKDAADVPINVPINPLAEKVCILLRANPKATIQKLALALGVTDRTIKRALKSLQESGIIRRVGARKTGHWEIIRPSKESATTRNPAQKSEKQ